MKHATVKTTAVLPDGSEKIVTKSYHEELSNEKEEIALKILTTRATLLHDVITCLAVITDDISNEVNIHIKEERGQVLITKTWTTFKKYHGIKN